MSNSQALQFKLEANIGKSDYLCEQCSLYIKPGSQFVSVNINSIMADHLEVLICLPCLDNIYPEIRSVCDPDLRFYA